MLKKLRIILGLVFIVVLCASLAACKGTQELDRYDVLVYYDSNGGKYGSRGGITIVNGFCFSDYEEDEEGNYHFKLHAPSIEDKNQGTLGLGKNGSFYLDWYRTRELVKDDEGKILDSEGRMLIEDVDDNDGSRNYYVVNSDGYFLSENGEVVVKRSDGYYIINTDTPAKRVISEPLYTYENKWDFENDELICNPEEGTLLDKDGNVIAQQNKKGKYELRLYTGWIPYFFFHYYTQTADGEWVKYGETYFDYSIVNSDNLYDTIFTPDWSEDGVMEHVNSHKGSNGITYRYTFPKVENCTFEAAYTDAACTQQINGSFVHPGTVNRENATAINRVQNIYVKVKDYVEYHISNAEQLAKNARLDGHYIIYTDELEFKGNVKWPNRFVSGEFTGMFVPKDGHLTIKGVSAAFNDNSASYGGIFGRIGAGAVVKGITFVDVQLDVSIELSRQECTLGLFTGEIDKKAEVSDIIISGENNKILLGKIANAEKNTINMLVGGDNKGGVTLSEGGVQLWAYGEFYSSTRYRFYVNPEDTVIDDGGNVQMVLTNTDTRYKTQEFIYITTYGGK